MKNDYSQVSFSQMNCPIINDGQNGIYQTKITSDEKIQK